eukprot:TRINITY_DN2472_c0_g1_i1.p1 TRINITY_DN2472_c0_g1~~TRINITY_DN2472_c0_g1_i1.p1  ORF type:complete len:273 (+),score=63.25 TRINITY_DN2472_c0_g1_i1:187-1005(+)
MPASPKIVARRSPGGNVHIPRGIAGQKGLDLVHSVVVNYHSSLPDVFSHFDADKNGSLFFTEFVQGLQPLGATPEEIQALWDAIDLERQGSVSYESFHQSLSVLTKNAGVVKWISPFNRVSTTNKVLDILMKSHESVEESFQVIDVNRNGWISKKEWKEKLGCFGIDKFAFSQREIDQAWRSLDQNGDGRVNWSEWVKAFKKISGSPKRQEASPSPESSRFKELSHMSREELERECASHRETLTTSAQRLQAATRQVQDLKAKNAELRAQLK